MKTFRKIVFWAHLCLAMIAGAVIFIMCVTGALLAFERNIIAYADSDAQTVTAPANAERLSAQQIVDAFKSVRPDVKPSAMTVTRDPNAAWRFDLGREGQIYMDPYTGTITGEGDKPVRAAMTELRNWHRYMALSGDQRPAGKLITGIANLVFLFLAVSGIYMWWPRRSNGKTRRPVVWFRGGLSGKKRNFNWHNVIGFWTSLFLVILTMTASVISFQWATNLLFTLTGNPVPTSAISSSNNPPPQTENEFVFPGNIDPLWAIAESTAPEWKSIGLRLPFEKNAAVFTVDEGIYWNTFGRSNLTLDALTGDIGKWDRYGEHNAALQIRSWFRYTHTGETFGIVGQVVALLAAIGGAFLVYTGWAQALHRCKVWRRENGTFES